MIFNKFKIIIYISLVVIFFSACSQTVSGRVVIKGNEPHTITVLKTEKYGEVKITGDLSKEIRSRYQGTVITVKGVVKKKALGPGQPAEFEVIKILND